MAVVMEQVRAALEPEEPDYPRAAKELGADALPHLERLVTGSEISLSAKAAYLAGLIGTDRCLPAIEKAARSSQTVVRIAAAAAAGLLPAQHADRILLELVDDGDAGVQKVALRAAPADMSDALKARVKAHAKAVKAPSPRKRAREKKKPKRR